jgi:cation diffusion facilitator CzcD-associated flavoprotein CzcO
VVTCRLDAVVRNGTKEVTVEARRRVHTAIVGAGFGGIGTGIKLTENGHRDFLIFDRGDDVGGTWRDNTYPGCACDVPSHLYSLSFVPNPRWTRSFSGQQEIWDYLRRTAADHGLRPHLRLRHEVRRADWDSVSGRWLIDTSQGPYSAELLVAAGGPLTEPAVPKLPGLETFGGEVFHSARWNHDYDLTGKRVAVVGTGASAIQFVPEIADRTARLHVFQRTAAWVMPRAEADGTVREVDSIVFGTGFHVTDMPMAELIRGRDGRTLAEAWQGSMNAYKGSCVTGFPNLVLMLGPNTGLGHTSVVFMIECQIAYLLGMMRHLTRAGGPIEPRPEAQRAYRAMIDRKMAGTVWVTGGCRSWYLDVTGRNSALWPGHTWSYWLRTRRFDPSAYRRVATR